MSIWTLEELDAHISAWKQTLLNLAKYKQASGPGGRSFTLEDSGEIRQMLAYLEQEKRKLAGNPSPRVLAGRTVK